ncbi:MAG: phage major capsid protein [Bacteroidota bacterium]
MKKNPNIRFKDVKRHNKIKLNGYFALSIVFAILCVGIYNADFSNIQISDAAGVSMAILPVFMVGTTFKELTGADLVTFKAEATAEQLGEYYEALNKFNRNKLEELIKANASKEDIDKLIEALKGTPDENLQKMKDEVVRIATELKALKENGITLSKDATSQIKAWTKENENAIKQIRSGQKAGLTPMVIKLNSPMTPSNTYNGSAYLPQPEFQSEVNEIVRVQPTFWDYIKKGRTMSAAYVWVNKKNPEGAAGFIAPGVIKPGISFEIATEISNAKKIAVSEKCSTELLEDIAGMQSWIEQELTYQLKQEMNSKLMTGTVSSTVPAGIQTISTTYSLTTVKTTNPNNWDAIRASVAQLRSGNLQGTVTAFVNPIDNANMALTKAQSQGQLFVPGDSGAVIVEDNNVPVGYVQIALLDYYKVLIYKDLTLTFGLDGEDFSHNLITGIAEMRIHQFFSENHTGAFIYDTFANIKTAINQA